MNTQTAWEGFSTLPPEAQRQVVDFIEFMKMRYKPAAKTKKVTRQTALKDEAFIGMWRDREDMQDSSQWVRDLRRKEWG